MVEDIDNAIIESVRKRGNKEKGMGNQQSVDPRHVNMYTKLIQIKSVQARVHTIQTVLTGPEYVTSAKITGVYPHLLNYIAAVQNGRMPPALPGETGAAVAAAVASLPPLARSHTYPQEERGITHYQSADETLNSFERITKRGRVEKAKSFFDACLDVLGIGEDIELTEESLKRAYNKVIIKVHPDKGGRKEDFDAVRQAYAYLGDILRRMKGGRSQEGKVEAPNLLAASREQMATVWKMPEEGQQVRLNPKNLNMTTFNEIFEKYKIPDPDEGGYGDWLKEEEAATAGTAGTAGRIDMGGGGGGGSGSTGGKYNRDTFNKNFEQQQAATQSRRGTQELAIREPAAMMLQPMAVELGRDRAEDFTSPANAKMEYTDLKQAYTTKNTFSGEVAGIRVENRDLKRLEAERQKAPEPLSHAELERVQTAERLAEERERQRKMRAAHEDVVGEEFFKRMKQFVITN